MFWDPTYFTDPGLDFDKHAFPHGDRDVQGRHSPPAPLRSPTNNLHDDGLPGKTFKVATIISAAPSLPLLCGHLPIFKINSSPHNKGQFSGCLSSDEQSFQMSHWEIKVLNILVESVQRRDDYRGCSPTEGDIGDDTCPSH